MNLAPYTRIILRYGVGYLGVKGFLPVELTDMITSDPELLTVLNLAAAALIGGVVEAWYILAKKFGWST